MGQKQQLAADPAAADAKKRRRVGFPGTDLGVEAKDCIQIYLVSSKEEVGNSSSFLIEPVDLNAFFGEDGKIYGYQGLKITVWVSSVSFHAFADIAFESTSDGGKGITDLNTALKDIFAETLVESKDEFLQTFSTQTNFIRSMVSGGEKLQHKTSNGQLEAMGSDLEVIRMVVEKSEAGPLYSHLIPIVLLLVDGSSPIDVTDPSWELYVLVQKKTDEQSLLLGFAALYRFYHYPDISRLRISQILVLPPYQHKGYGRHLLETLNNVAIAEDVFDLTIEEPLDSLQHVRTCIDIPRLLALGSIQKAVNEAASQLKEGKMSKKTLIPRMVPPHHVIEEARKALKINKKQFLQCWEVLVYLGLDPLDKYVENFVDIVSNRMKEDIIGKDSDTAGKKVVQVPSDYDEEMSFVMFRSKSDEAVRDVPTATEESQPNQEEQLRKLVEERVEEIKLLAEKVLHYRV